MNRSPIHETPADSAMDLRRRASRFLLHPGTEVSILILIVLSVVLLVLEYLLTGAQRRLVELLGHGLTAVFIVELTLRYWVARKKSRFFKRYWLDILAVLPVIRPLRVLRVLRLFRMGVLVNRSGRRYGTLFRRRTSELTTLLSLTLTMVLMGAMVLQTVEPAVADRGFEAALWFSMASLVAGDPVGETPHTFLGRFTTLALMVGGLTVFGMFVATISATMVNRLSGRTEVHELDLDELEDHVLVCGWNRSGPTVLAELFGPGSAPDLAVVLITEAEHRPVNVPLDRVREEHLYYVSGDYTRVEVLEHAGVRRAASAVLLSDNTKSRSDQDTDARTVLAALTIERLREGIFTCAELTNRQNESMLRTAKVEEIVVGEWYAGVVLGASVRTPGIVSVMDEILTNEHGNAFHTVHIPSLCEGWTIGRLHGYLLEQHRAVLVSHTAAGSASEVNPDPEQVVSKGDQLVVLSRGPVTL